MNNTGRPAFPTKSYDVASQTWTIEEGMTLRDYFAAKAMQGLLAHPECFPVGRGHEAVISCVVEESYMMADAMLKAREQ